MTDRVRGVRRDLVNVAREYRREPTPAERVLWAALRGRQVGGLKFRRQHALGPFILDFCCAEHRLVVEVDGSVHDDPEQADRDAHRTQHLERFGYTIMRVRNDDVLHRLDEVLARIREAAEAWGEGRHQ